MGHLLRVPLQPIYPERRWCPSGAFIASLQAAFVESWLEATGMVLSGRGYFPDPLPEAGDVKAQIVASAPSKRDYAVYTTFLLAIRAAQRSVRITNPYFVPDDAMTEALIDAVRRGVRVEVLIPGTLDSNIVRAASRAALGPLLRNGIVVYEYQPALLHAKTMVIDRVWTTIGSANLDPRSMSLNAELNAVIYDGGVARRMEAIFAADVAAARRLRYTGWLERPIWRRFLGWLAIPFRDEL